MWTCAIYEIYLFQTDDKSGGLEVPVIKVSICFPMTTLISLAANHKRSGRIASATHL